MKIAVFDLKTGVWRVPGGDALPFFEDQGLGSEYRKKWPRAGSVCSGVVSKVESTQKPPPRGSERLWPTPAASLPNDGEEPAQWLARWVRVASSDNRTRAGVPLAVAARAPSVMRLSKIGSIKEAQAALEENAKSPDPELSSRDKLNPEWVEHLMGFPPGWTDLD